VLAFKVNVPDTVQAEVVVSPKLLAALVLNAPAVMVRAAATIADPAVIVCPLPLMVRSGIVWSHDIAAVVVMVRLDVPLNVPGEPKSIVTAPATVSTAFITRLPVKPVVMTSEASAFVAPSTVHA
jgi:hypothetical protein